MDSKQIDAAARAVQKGDRVSLADIDANIAEVHFMNLENALFKTGAIKGPLGTHPSAVYTYCIIVMKNGYVVDGYSAAADPANYDAKIGQQFAYDQAIKKIWPLLGFQLRDKLYERSQFGTGSPETA